jgi:predicted N-formylglutamate amidohydrolase
VNAYTLILTCEHGGNRIPSRYRSWFESSPARAALAGHNGYDAGALALARALSRSTGAPLLFSTTSRLLIDLNRSPGNPRLFSRFVAGLSSQDRACLVERRLLAHRQEVEATVDVARRHGRKVLHVAVHSFTPCLDGAKRNADIGLLYDSKSARERAFAARWQAALKGIDPDLRVRRNYPYNGADDGLTRHLRRRYPAGGYLGFELEVNQATLARRSKHVARTVAASFEKLSVG